MYYVIPYMGRGGDGGRGSQKRPIFACFQCRKYANIGGRGGWGKNTLKCDYEIHGWSLG